MRRIIIAFLFITLFFGMSVHVFADDVQVYVKSGYSGNEDEFFAPPRSEKIKILSPSISGASTSGDGDKPYRRTSHGIIYTNTNIITEPEDGVFGGTASITLDYGNYTHILDGYSVLRFGVWFKFDSEDITDIYDASVLFVTDEGDSITCDFRVPSDSASLVSVNLSGVSGTISYFTLTVNYDSGNAPSLISLSSPYISTDEDTAFLSADRYSTDKLKASFGMISSSTGRVRPNDGEAVISGNFVSSVHPEQGTTAYMAVKLSGIESGGMSIGVTFAGTADEQFYQTKRVALSDSTGSAETILFPIRILDDIESFTMYFSGIESDNVFVIESIQLLEGRSVPAEGNHDIGTVTSLVRGSDYVFFEGTMEKEAVRNFRGGYINFYAIPASSAHDLTSAYLLGSVKVSTVFSFSADFSSASGMCDTFMFFAAVPRTDENGVQTLLPLSRPRYPDASPLAESKVSLLGLSGAASVGVFEANVSNTTVNIDLCELITDSGRVQISYVDYDRSSDTVCRISLSNELLSALDSEIQFYISSGTQVFIQLTASSPVEGLTYSGSAESYMPDLTQPGARYYWAAIIRYLSERFSGISGYILGQGVNCADLVSGDAFMTDGLADEEKLTGYAASLAELTRITYSAAGIYIEDMPVIVPFVPAQTDESGIDAVHLALLLSDRLSQTGYVPWTMQWMLTSFDSRNEPAFSEFTALRRRLEELEITLPAAYTFYLEPDSDELLLSYGEYVETKRALGEAIPEYSDYAADIFDQFYEKCGSYHARAAFVSIEGHPLKHDHAFYSAIKNIGMSDRFVYEAEAVYGSLPTEYSYTLFDFSDKHYPLGWIAGGGVSSCLTDLSEIFTDDEGHFTRALKIEFSNDLGFVDNIGAKTSNNAGITLRNLSRMYNFSEITSVEFSLALHPASETPVSGDVTVVMMIGSDDYRSEYYASGVSAEEILTLTCDLSEYIYRNTVDYIGIMVYSDSPVHLELSNVRVGSNTLTSKELKGTFIPDEDETEVPDLSTAAIVIAVSVIFSIIVIVILTHYDREEDERREAALAEASKHRRIRR